MDVSQGLVSRCSISLSVHSGYSITSGIFTISSIDDLWWRISLQVSSSHDYYDCSITSSLSLSTGYDEHSWSGSWGLSSLSSSQESTGHICRWCGDWWEGSYAKSSSIILIDNLLTFVVYMIIFTMWQSFTCSSHTNAKEDCYSLMWSYKSLKR